MSLFGQLHLGLGGLRAQQYGLEVTGDNIANVATPGFSRRRLALSHAEALERYPVGQLGGGVKSGPVSAVRDRFLELRHRIESSVAAGDDARKRLLAGVEAVFLEDGGFGFQGELSELFLAFEDLAAEPESLVLRDQVVSRAQSLIDRMQGGYRRLDEIVQEADRDLVRLTSQVNDKIERLAELNELVMRTEGRVPANAERDERAQVLLELSGLIEVASYENGDGSVTVTLRDGSALVVGREARTLTAAAVGASGRVSLFLGTTDVTPLMGSGAVGGMLEVRDTDIPAFQRQLDTLALELMQQVNAVHRSGFALDGVTTGLDFFSPFTPPGPTDPTGATMAMAVEPGIVADATRIAAAATASATGDGDQAAAIFDLSKTPVLNGGAATFDTFYAGFVFDLGTAASRARTAAEASAAVADHVEQQKLAVSAVSLDEEAVALVQFQRGYEASARFIRVVDELTQVVMSIGA